MLTLNATVAASSAFSVVSSFVLRRDEGKNHFPNVPEYSVLSCELLQSQPVIPEMCPPSVLQFDEAVIEHGLRVQNPVSVRGSLNTCRLCVNMQTSVLSDVEFREVTEHIAVGKVKIVAYNGKNTGSSTTE